MKASKFILIITLLFLFTGLTTAQSKRDIGIELYRAGEFEKAAAILIEATEVDEKDRTAWIYLGASMVKQGKNKEAIKTFKKGGVRKKEDLAGNEMRAEIVNRPRARYTDLARENMTSGVVKLAMEFGADGKIRLLAIVQSAPYGLTEQSIAAAKAIKFRPPVKDGKALTTVELIEYTFEVR